MIEIDYEALNNAIQDNIDETLLARYDFDTICNSAEKVWDNTAVQVKASDFMMVFDLISYELLDYNGNDIIGE